MLRRTLGRSGIGVSSLGLGAAPWGTTTSEDEAARLLRRFAASGGNLLDTADNYGRGRSEEMIGRLAGRVIPRSELVIATKAGAIAGRPAFRHDASRRHLLDALEASLRRLQTDYIDVWQVHIWDDATPLEETLGALETAVSSGRARCVGVSNYAGWQLARAAACSSVPLASCQMEYSLLERGIERELVPAAIDAGVSLLAWAPLGRGVLTGKYVGGVPASKADDWFFNWYVRRRLLDERTTPIVETVLGVAADLGVSAQAVSLAWVRDRPAVASALVGARTAGQLDASLGAERLELPSAARAALDAASRPFIGYPERALPSSTASVRR